MGFDEVADELYGLPPEEFVAVRDERAAAARAGGDTDLAKRVKGLRRPTVTGWAVNRLVRQDRAGIDWLLEVGAELRAAWEAGGDLAGVERRRTEVLAALMRTARGLADGAGRQLPEQALREVEETLHAATNDPAIADEVSGGRLVRGRRYAGLGPVAGHDAAAGPALAGTGRGTGRGTGGRTTDRARRDGEPAAEPAGPRPARETREDRERRGEGERRARLAERLRAAEATAADAERARGEWEDELAGAEEELTATRERLEAARRELAEADERHDGAQRRFAVARRERDRAARTADSASRDAAAARRALDAR